MNPRVVAVCGKGGVGKTTISAMLATALRREGRPTVLVIDADPCGGLAMALGLTVKRSVSELRRETIREVRHKETTASELARGLDYLLTESFTEVGNLAFLSIGRPEETGCYCSVNGLLREAIETLAGEFALTLIDAEAGIEQINRQVMKNVELLLLVADRSAKALRVVEEIRQVALSINPLCETRLVINRMGSEEEAREALARSPLESVGWIPEDAAVGDFDAEERSFFELPECPAYRAVTGWAQSAGLLTVAEHE